MSGVSPSITKRNIAPKPDTRRCYTSNLTGHISKNCQQFRAQGKAINTLFKNKFNLHSILDTGVAVALVPDIKYLSYPTKVNTDKTIKLTDGTTLPLNYRGTFNLIWENGDKLTLNDVYTAPGINDVIILAVHLIKRQRLICMINKNNTYLYCEQRENGDGHELEHDGDVIQFERCALNWDTALANDEVTANGNNTVAVSVDSSDDNNVRSEMARCIGNKCMTNSVRKNNKKVVVKIDNNLVTEYSEANRKNAITWDRRLGHINYRRLGEAYKTVDGIGKVITPNVVCEVCAEAKATRKPFKQIKTRANKPGFKTHAR